ncbi:arrestin (macronuclear) [Tetrahymena thermophila SB210]|uniref:Arrestin n=1 Tax=Tetrahymena thermophila (strain SB210) TaxID=312017 RepID=Q229A0_TETTS|nr:arrestin [Tetrahymena thermophila SB210]EAR81861.1 arrestin [Tetrahymena thermophila SB210]|eukprot:XP_001029524.1 arrestin [Tetrahymena thermophila SB210]
MGQSNPKDKRRQIKGGIFIQLQKTYFVSNEVVQGLLNISLEEPFQGHILQITLNGLEETSYIYTIRIRKHTKTYYAKGYNDFLNFSIPIYDFSQGSRDPTFILKPCQLVIPFQLQIVDQLPSSMKYFYSEGTQCSLKYSLIAQILPTEPNMKPIYGSQDIFIGQQISAFGLSNNTISHQEPVLCCCCRSGQIFYNITMNSRCFSPGETINLKMDIDFSQYGKTVKSLNIKLIGQLTMKANDTERSKLLTISEKSMNHKVNSSKVKQDIQFQLPTDLALSSQGQLIQVVYYLQITPEISTVCCVSNNTPHEIKIYINPNPNQLQNNQLIPQQLQIQAPKNWNPVQLQPSLINQSLISQNQKNNYPLQNQNQNNLIIMPNSMLPKVKIQQYGQPQMINQNQDYL